MSEKYRIIEEKAPLMQAYLDETSELESDIKYSNPFYSVECKKHVFSKWEKVCDVQTIKEGLFRIHRFKIERMPFIKRIIYKENN
jgi:hypothetical protein